MIVLGVDAGVTTGLAIVTEGDHRVLYTKACPLDALEPNLLRLVPTVDKVIVERALPYKRSRLGKKLEEVHMTIQICCPEAIWCSAADWKNTGAKHVAAPRGLTPHERDAIRIAVWYVSKKRPVIGVVD